MNSPIRYFATADDAETAALAADAMRVDAGYRPFEADGGFLLVASNGDVHDADGLNTALFFDSEEVIDK